ncbi:MAG: 3-oxoacyl-ACP reductase FabG [Methylotenera sp.]|nr:MAG: 3-oxoacyl-ACP reductase FabG [Methylotenera sp.]
MKKALITGGCGGIGAAISKRLAADGFHVYIHANQNIANAITLAEEIRAQGGTADTLQFDVTDGVKAAEILSALVEDTPIQVLVNNAGIHDDAVLPGMRPDQWSRVIDVSVNGFFNVTQPLMMAMIRSRWGRIINVSSISGITGNRGQTNYSAAKGAINAATKSLSLEVASRGITVNAVAPGIITTTMSNSSFNAEAISQMVPMKRAGTPEEVANLISFLASDQATYITGQVISINGGMI